MKKFIAYLILALYVPMVAFGAVTVTVNGVSHTIPQTNERGWGTNVTAWIQAISANTLQPTGGSFTLSSDVDFGGTAGLEALYYKSRSENLSSSGVLRLGNTDAISWRNAANSANLPLTVNSSNQLTYNGIVLSSSSGPSFQDSLLRIFDNSDTTKLLAFELSGLTTATTRTLTVPDANTTIVGTDATQTLTNKTLTSPSMSTVTVSSGGVAVTGDSSITGALSFPNQNEVRFQEQTGNGSNYVGFEAPDSISSNQIWKLPDADGTNGQFIQTDGSGALTFADAAQLTYRSVTTTDSPTTADDILGLSGASFTVTLPTAVGNDGKIFELLHLGTSLTQAYTLATTSAQTIGGIASGSYVLHTNGERLKIVSDGANWQILGHHTSTDPTNFTVTSSLATNATWVGRWWREGRFMNISAHALFGGATDTATASITIPGGLSCDTSFLSSTITTSQGQIVGTIKIHDDSSNVTTEMVAGISYLLSSTTIGGALLDPNSATTHYLREVSNTVPFTIANADILEINAKIPITGWQP